eukprot:249170-Pelagomonas_calceolata.AAC.3
MPLLPPLPPCAPVAEYAQEAWSAVPGVVAESPHVGWLHTAWPDPAEFLAWPTALTAAGPRCL